MIRTILIGLVGACLLASPVSAQQPGRHQGDTATATRSRPMMDMMTMSMMDSADARLDRMVGTMNKATGNRRMQAMAAVINELVAQRKMMRMHARQMMMGPGGMMGTGMGGGRNMPNRSPTFPDTASAPAKPDTADHAEHHQP
jgi:hypothetical protein